MSAIFLCYRRDDAAGYVHAIRDRLVARLGSKPRIFMDMDSIEPGLDFKEVIESSLASCSVLLALIGKRWSPERLQDSRDFVRLEIQTALEKKIRVIPVLLDGAEMPKPEALPAELAPLSRRQAYEVSGRRFNDDAEGLADQVEKILREQKSKKSPPKPKSTPPKPDPPAEWNFDTPAPVQLKRLGWGGGLVYLLSMAATLVYFIASLYPNLTTDMTLRWVLYFLDAVLLLGWILRICRRPSYAAKCFGLTFIFHLSYLVVRFHSKEFGISHPPFWAFGLGALIFFLMYFQLELEGETAPS